LPDRKKIRLGHGLVFASNHRPMLHPWPGSGRAR
jgi:hypothetical protein